MAASEPGQVASSSPVLVAQGLDDTTVPAPATRAITDGLCRIGQPLLHRDYPGVDHLGVLGASDDLAVAWTADRFAGRPAPSSCPPNTPEEKFVRAGYQDFLGRPARPDEVVGAAQPVAAGAASRRDIVTLLAASPEWLSAVVNRLYVDTLGRPGDPGGLAYWTGRLRTRALTVADVAARFFGSAEYYARAGGNDRAWVTDLYGKLLGRPPDPGGLDYWVGQTAAQGRDRVVLRFYQSEESARARVADLYQRLLGRSPDPAGHRYWSGRVVSTGDLTLAIDLASSPEYLDRAQRRF